MYYVNNATTYRHFTEVLAYFHTIVEYSIKILLCVLFRKGYTHTFEQYASSDDGHSGAI